MGRQLGQGWKPMALAGGAAAVMALMPGLPLLPFLALAGAAGATAWPATGDAAGRRGHARRPGRVAAEPPVADALRLDLLRLELGYGLLSLAAGEAPRLTEQIKALRRSMAQEMGFVLPSVRIQDNLELPPDT